MIDFGYSITKSNSIDLDKVDNAFANAIRKAEPSFGSCIGCGTCTAGCSTGSFTAHNPRELQLLIHYGKIEQVETSIKKCMLCGKCQMLCPRGVNLRNLWYTTSKIIQQTK